MMPLFFRPVSLFFLLLHGVVSAAPASPAQWEVSQGLTTPESAVFDATSNHIFVSNVAGDAKKADGEGWISKLSADGKVVSDKWVKGLNAPKGMGITGRTLWVSDIQHLLQINIDSGKVEQRTFIPSARFLNDIAIGPDDSVYISDTLGSRIYVHRRGKTEIFAQGNDLESPNGLLVHDGQLVVAAWGLTSDFTNPTAGRVYSLNLQTKEKVAVTTDPLGNLDGLVWDGRGFLVSDWVAGKVLHVTPDGKSVVVLSGIKGAADIGWLKPGHTLLVPKMAENRLGAYRLLN